MRLERREILALIAGGAAAGLGASCAPARTSTRPIVNESWVVSDAELIDWHRQKLEKGPALTGTESWRQFMTFVENKLNEYGCADVHRSSWMFKQLETSTWPDDSGWSLVSDGRSVPLSNYGANCGLTGPEGVTAELVEWDPQNPPNVEGKIVVYRPTPRPEVRELFSDSDYEFMTPFDSYPEEGTPVPQELDGTNSVASPVWDDMTSSSTFIREIAAARPAGVVFAMNLNKAETAGLYTFGVPDHYDFPSVYVDRINGDAVLADARVGREATIRVEGRHVEAEAYQLIAYLPGRHYGTDLDEQIQMRTHTDGPSISQDNGAFGLLAVAKYFSNIPQEERARTLFLEFDCRHFMPGAERSWHEQDYFVKNPSARDKIVAMIAMEHMGQIEYVADGDEIRPSGRSLPTWMYSSPHDAMLQAAYQAAVDNNVRGAIIRSPGRDGIHGRSQGPWYGMSGGGQYLGLPTYGVQGDLGAYWAHSAGLDRLDTRSFRRQTATFVQLTSFFMDADFNEIRVPTVERPADRFFR